MADPEIKIVSDTEKIYAEMLRQTERRLDAQRERAVTRDQRALVVAAFSSAFAGATARTWSENGGGASGGAVAFLAIAAIFAAFSALPRPIHGAGSQFKSLAGLAQMVENHASFLASLGRMNDALINLNDRRELVAEHCYRFSLLLFAVGVALIGIPFLGD